MSGVREQVCGVREECGVNSPVLPCVSSQPPITSMCPLRRSSLAPIVPRGLSERCFTLHAGMSQPHIQASKCPCVACMYLAGLDVGYQACSILASLITPVLIICNNLAMPNSYLQFHHLDQMHSINLIKLLCTILLKNFCLKVFPTLFLAFA
jgi:hypothetical protein